MIRMHSKIGVPITYHSQQGDVSVFQQRDQRFDFGGITAFRNDHNNVFGPDDSQVPVDSIGRMHEYRSGTRRVKCTDDFLANESTLANSRYNYLTFGGKDFFNGLAKIIVNPSLQLANCRRLYRY